MAADPDADLYLYIGKNLDSGSGTLEETVTNINGLSFVDRRQFLAEISLPAGSSKFYYVGLVDDGGGGREVWLKSFDITAVSTKPLLLTKN